MPEKYPGLKFVIESTYGCYPVGAWCFVSSRETIEEARVFCDKWGSEYRIVDSYGVVIYPPPTEEPTNA